MPHSEGGDYGRAPGGRSHDIVGETEEQKQAGRIKYLVVAEERGICIQQTRDNAGTRRDRRDVNTGHDPDPNHYKYV